MNTAPLKTYAPAARQAFIAAVSAQAARLGITASGTASANVQGDVLLVEGHAFPKAVATARRNLAERVAAQGFVATMEAIAYTWFNRFVAIRYMELHNYFDHGYRVLSHPEGQGRPEILDHAADVDLPGLDRAKAVALKLDGTQDEALYRLLLKAQCNALHQAMPFLFEHIGDETELLLPANLLHTDSLIRQLVEAVDEGAWDQIEIIGWLYQFYISEKKDQVIGKVVKSEDIPAATQLFTPNWIVKYMVQNSLGAQWLATYPESPLKGQMEYYIELAEQTDEVKAQLAAITPKTLDPEVLTLIDPACGSGHILVEAYDLFKAIYLERGYRQRDVAKLILEKNLFGLDIDERAVQLSGFALMMKGRADDRRLFERGVTLNVMALVKSEGFDANRLAEGMRLAEYGLELQDFVELKVVFEHAKTFGSLIQVPIGVVTKLPALMQVCRLVSEDLFVSDALRHLRLLVRQAQLLASRYDSVVANPPYMGIGYYCGALKKFVGEVYKAGKTDLYSAFTLRNMRFAKKFGSIGMITIPNWMFLSSFKHFRGAVFMGAPIRCLAHIGRGVWGSDFGSCSYVLRRGAPAGLCGRFLRLFKKQGSIASNEELERRFHVNPRFSVSNSEFRKIPGSPVGYWVSEKIRNAFVCNDSLGSLAVSGGRMKTHNDAKYVRMIWEVDATQIGRDRRWLCYEKGGEFRKWYGGRTFVVDWCLRAQDDYGSHGGLSNPKYWGREGVTWSQITVGASSFRKKGRDAENSSASPTVFTRGTASIDVLALLNSKPAAALFRILNPTVNANPGDVLSIPVPAARWELCRTSLVLDLAKYDWDAYERSWGFTLLPILAGSAEPTPSGTLKDCYTEWTAQNRTAIAEMKRLEEENNRLFIDAYGVADELTPDVPIEQITLTVNPAYRYGSKLTEAEQWTRFRQDTMTELVSYAIGCMMGRYSLDEPGLIYAYSGNDGFDPSRYPTFPADDDGIVPVTDTAWFDDDASNRLVEFLSVAWDPAHLEANLTFLADNLSPKKNESSRDTIRRYLCTRFYKDHKKTYKKRPIYWLFTSGKLKAFQCLVYLHRYNEGTLSRMRSEYVIPLQGKMAARLEKLSGDIAVATSTAHQRRLEKERIKLAKQQVELLAFDEKLRHYADRRIVLDLDDGVKVNYGKFGDLLADVKEIHGKKPETV